MLTSTFASKQTGPRTAAGKERSSDNATLHGGTSNKLIVTGENESDFHALLTQLLDDYQPDTPESHLWVENAAKAHWFLWRRQRAYNAIESSVYQQQPDPAAWTEEHIKRLSLADRYKTQAERAMKRAQTYLDQRLKSQRAESVRHQKNAQWQAAQDIRERRMTLQEQKFELAQAREADRAFRLAKNAVSSPRTTKRESEFSSEDIQTVEIVAGPDTIDAVSVQLNRKKAA